MDFILFSNNWIVCMTYFQGLGTRESVLIEIMTTRSNSQIQAIKEVYFSLYEKSVESDIKGDTSGDFEDLLIALLKGKRDESLLVDAQRANEDAQVAPRILIFRFRP